MLPLHRSSCSSAKASLDFSQIWLAGVGCSMMKQAGQAALWGVGVALKDFLTGVYREDSFRASVSLAADSRAHGRIREQCSLCLAS
ncbi:hypothetical protein QQF64_002312 [Cirrhinus molitorella]|uniref:Uncharacterized protein n=1 Tax=Cirrhinus molitorella TaxID=172907 RepID=A0ABR3MPS5_9TELE